MMTQRPDFYATLGLAAEATQEEIAHAYRVLLRQHHPDTRGPGNPSDDDASDVALQRVLAAYHVLGDPARRADYDRARLRVAPRRRPAPGSFTTPVRPPIIAGPVHWDLPR